MDLLKCPCLMYKGRRAIDVHSSRDAGLVGSNGDSQHLSRRACFKFQSLVLSKTYLVYTTKRIGIITSASRHEEVSAATNPRDETVVE